MIHLNIINTTLLFQTYTEIHKHKLQQLIHKKKLRTLKWHPSKE